MKPNFRTQLERNLLNIAHTGLLSSNSAGQYGHHFQTFPGEPSVFFVFVVLQDCHNSSRLLHNRADYSAYLDPMSLIKIEHRAEHSRPRVSTDRRCPRWRCRERPSARLVSFPGSHRLQALCGGAPDRHHVAPPTEARLYRIAHLNSGYAERERRHFPACRSISLSRQESISLSRQELGSAGRRSADGRGSEACTGKFDADDEHVSR
jgi:hypothetical protein